MFDLERSITNWRRSWAKYSLEDERFEELERHLRDACEAHRRSGLTDEEAWQRALAELGSPLEVSREIKKIDGRSRAEIWVVIGLFTAVAIFYFWALISMRCVPFGNHSMPFAQAMRHVADSALDKSLEAIASVPGLMFCLMLVCMARYLKSTQKGFRLLICMAALITPFLFFMFMGGFGLGFELWTASAIFAPWATFEMAAGQVDGEFYADGDVWASAIGWWIILWNVLSAVETFRVRRALSGWYARIRDYRMG